MNTTSSRTEEIFADALALPAAERGAFLAQACGANQELLAHLLALLAAHDTPDSLTGLTLTSPASHLPEEAAGDIIGRYKLLQRLGEGGCGVVWMAEQTEPVRRRVALKVIKLGMDTRAVVARFEAERQALALMAHPNIAKVLDGGSTATGRPFFVMEMVRGIRITKHCDDQQLNLKERLTLFVQVCEAVQHAHQKGIIHRDLKPSNILVSLTGSVGTPKVIDFGIAKAIQGRLTDATVFTADDQIIGTPAYMSPEQADTAGVDVDTRTDVYSLGVLLYELLSGQCPFDPSSSSNPNELRRLIREVEPPRPSTRFATLTNADRASIARRRSTDPARLPLLLAGELDWIVMRAMEKNRARRYDTPAALADDIGRYLRNEPVIARPPGGLYRCRKFLRRNRLAVTAVAAVVVTLVAATAMSVAQAIRATQAERKASATWSRVVDERARADELLTVMFDDLKAPLAKIGELRVLDRVIDKALAYYGTYEVRDLDDRTLMKHVVALNQLGGLRMDQARYPDAGRAYREAFDRASVLVTRNPRDPAMLAARGQAESGNGFVRVRQGQIAAAREWFQRETATRVQLVALEPSNPRWPRELAKQQHDLGSLEMNHGDPEQARRIFRAELATLEPLAAKSPDDVELRGMIASVNAFLGRLAESAGEYGEAEQRFAEQANQLAAIGRSQPRDRNWDLKLADSLSCQAGVAAITRRRKESAEYLARARRILAAMSEPAGAKEQRQRASVEVDLREAQLAGALGDFARGVEKASAARRLLEALTLTQPTDIWVQERLALALRIEAELEHALHRPAAAALAARAIEVGEQLLVRPGPTQLQRAERAAAGAVAGRIAAAEGNEAAARSHWQRAQRVIAVDLAAKDWRVLDPAARLARYLGESERAAGIIGQLTAFGYVPLEPWP